MQFTGYIEGYYGRELSWQQRKNMVTHIASLGMNVFFYAPKEDPYHRLKWEKKYPLKWQGKISSLATFCKRENVTFIPALAPGLSFDYTSDNDYEILLNKFLDYFKMDINTVALLMDDIDEHLPEKSKQSYPSLGYAHGILLKRLINDCRKINSLVNFWFCPTIYTDDFVKGDAVNSIYIKDLHKIMPKSITLMWTGPMVVSKTINQKNSGAIVSLFNGNVVIWDNFWANDYTPLRLFIGSYTGRSLNLLKKSKGVCINPTGMFHTDRFLLSLFADFLNSEKTTVKRWTNIATEYDISPIFISIKKFFWSPFTISHKKDFSQAAIEKYSNIFNTLIVKWVNPLKLEWYPFIHAFSQNIQYIKMDKNKRKSWANTHYPPYIAQRMINKDE